MFGALALSSWVAWRDIEVIPARGARTLAIGVGLLVLGGRMLALLHHSDPVPYRDACGSEAFYLLIERNGGCLDWQALFASQPEHRILLTRLVA